MQQPEFGAYIYSLQGFQVTFATTRAGTYTLSSALNGVDGWQVGGSKKTIEALPGALYGPTSTLVLGAGFDGPKITAGATGQVELQGQDEYGATSCYYFVEKMLRPATDAHLVDWPASAGRHRMGMCAALVARRRASLSFLKSIMEVCAIMLCSS